MKRRFVRDDSILWIPADAATTWTLENAEWYMLHRHIRLERHFAVSPTLNVKKVAQ
jgi:hypothetical protein